MPNVPMSESGSATLGDHRGPELSQEQKHHHHHQDDREQQRELHIVNGSADGFRAVGQDINMNGGGIDAVNSRKQLSSPDRPFE